MCPHGRTESVRDRREGTRAETLGDGEIPPGIRTVLVAEMVPIT